ncbi:MAG: hypothetical protein NC218_02345 [Acetobacter sp.]|nr:hypothetical protein [Acetobacter sp.]
MATRASFTEGYKVQKTQGKAAQGKHSLLALNNEIVAAADTSEVFAPMFRICLICANQRKLISKVRGDSNDFLYYATMGYVERWRKQFGAKDARRPMQMIQNWIPYVLGTIRFSLMSYNKEVYDYDFLPLPKLYDDDEDDAGSERDVPDTISKDPLLTMSMQALTNREALHSIVEQMPEELQPYMVDILYYIRTRGMLLSFKRANFVKIGKAIFTRLVEQWIN